MIWHDMGCESDVLFLISEKGMSGAMLWSLSVFYVLGYLPIVYIATYWAGGV